MYVEKKTWRNLWRNYCLTYKILYLTRTNTTFSYFNDPIKPIVVVTGFPWRNRHGEISIEKEDQAIVQN